MNTETRPYIHVNFVRYSETWCAVNECPTCERHRRMLARYQEWYGTTWTCAGCGDQWTDGERHPRPFAPGWRKDNIEHARKVLTEIGVQA
jgi:ribosomal protein L37AE/L43A